MGILLVYDVTDERSFNSTPFLLFLLSFATPHSSRSGKNLPRFSNFKLEIETDAFP
jgi:hypothetical protein